MVKKWRIVLVALLVLAMMVPSAFAAETTFRDVTDDYWAASYIRRAASAELVVGIGSELFAPAIKVGTDQFSAVLCNLLYEQELEATRTGISEDAAWWLPYLETVYSLGALEQTTVGLNRIKTGYWDSNLVAAGMSRYDMAQMIYMAVLTQGWSLPEQEEIAEAQASIADWQEISTQYQAAVSTCYAMGLLTGTDGYGTFSGDNSMTRAEMSVVLCRLLDEKEAYEAWLEEQELAEEEPVQPTEPTETEAEEEDIPLEDLLGGNYITFQGKKIRILENLAVNSYDSDGYYTNEYGWILYDKDGVVGVPGIDVSTYQKTIDWQQVADSGIEFAIIRVGYRGYGSEGNMRLDNYFHENMQGALDAGLDVGVYFFSQATNLSEVEAEVDFLLEALDGYSLSYPVVFDWEFVSGASARTDECTGEEITEMALHFCKLIEQAGYQPAIYFNLTLAYRYLDLEALAQYPFWLAQYNGTCTFYYDYDIWQYSDSGTVPGIEGKVDMNLSFYKSS